MAKYKNAGKYFGIALSFGVTMFVSIWLASTAGAWIDTKLGTNSVFEFIGILCGVFSGFRLLMENIRSLERDGRPKQ